MNWEAIGAVGEIVGALAVVVSLVYLASQLRHANELARENAYRELQSAVDQATTELVRDPDLHKVWREALYERKSVSDSDRERIGFLLSRVFGSLNVAYHSSRQDSDLRDFVYYRLDVYLENPIIRGWWRRQRMQHPDPFRSMVDAKVKQLDESAGVDVEQST